MKRPLACILGLHSWYVDSGLLASAMKCNRCEKAENPADAARLDAERARIDSAPPGLSLAALYLIAAEIPIPDGLQ